MPYTDTRGRVWPDREVKNGVTYILDPFASAQGGRAYYRPDPKQKQQWAEESGFAEKAPRQPSPWEGLAMGAAGTGLGVTAATVGQSLGSSVAGQSAQEILKEKLAEQALAKLEAEAAASAGQQVVAGQATQQAVGQTASEGLAQAGTTAGTEAGAGSILANASAMGPLPIAAIGASTLAGGKAAYDMLQGEKPDLFGRATLGIATGGLSEVANSLFGGKSLQEKRADEAASLVGKGVFGYDDYYKNSLQPGMSGGLQSSMPFNEQFEKTRDEAFLRPEDVWGATSNFIADPQWLSYSEDQRRQIAQQALGQRLYREGDGGIDIIDPARFQEIVKQVVAGQSSTQPAMQSLQPVAAIPNLVNPQVPARTRLAEIGIPTSQPIQTLPAMQPLTPQVQNVLQDNYSGFTFMPGKDPRQQLAIIGV